MNYQHISSEVLVRPSFVSLTFTLTVPSLASCAKEKKNHTSVTVNNMSTKLVLMDNNTAHVQTASV